VYQVTFSDESATTFKQLPQARQLKMTEALSQLSPQLLEAPQEPLGRFKRAEVIYYRYRLEDLRFYFILKDQNLHCLFILTKNTWADFLLRSNFEKVSESEIEANPTFIKFLEGKQL